MNKNTAIQIISIRKQQLDRRKVRKMRKKEIIWFNMRYERTRHGSMMFRGLELMEAEG